MLLINNNRVQIMKISNKHEIQKVKYKLRLDQRLATMHAISENGTIGWNVIIQRESAWPFEWLALAQTPTRYHS